MKREITNKIPWTEWGIANAWEEPKCATKPKKKISMLENSNAQMGKCSANKQKEVSNKNVTEKFLQLMIIY